MIRFNFLVVLALLLSSCEFKLFNELEYCKKQMPNLKPNQPNIKNGFFARNTNSGQPLFIKIIDINHIKEIRARKDKPMNAVNITLDKNGAQLMKAFSSKNVGNKMAYFVDNEMINEATIQATLGSKFTMPIKDLDKAKYISDYTSCYLAIQRM